MCEISARFVCMRSASRDGHLMTTRYTVLYTEEGLYCIGVHVPDSAAHFIRQEHR